MASRLPASSRTGSFSLTVRSMGPRQPSGSNVADLDIILGIVPSFLSCLSANGPTARPVGPVLQALNLSGLHSATRVPFFPSDNCFRGYTNLSLVSLRILALSGLALRVSWADCYQYTVGTSPFSSSHGCELHHQRVVSPAMRRLSPIFTRCGGICSIISLCFE